jgi:hypothetical protein
MVSMLSGATVMTGRLRHKPITDIHLDQPDRSQGWLQR